jgi:hypothetical protein
MTEQGAEAELLDWTSVKLYGEFVDGARLVIERRRARSDARRAASATATHSARGLPGHPVARLPRGLRPRGRHPLQGGADTKHLPHGNVGFVLIGATMREYVPPKES